MIKLIGIAAFALTVATSAQAMSPAPLPQLDGMVTQVAAACGVAKRELTVSAWPEPPSAKRAVKHAGARYGAPGTLAFSGNKN